MTTNNEQESFMTQVLSQPGKHSPGQIIAAVAMGRWLNVSFHNVSTLFNVPCRVVQWVRVHRSQRSFRYYYYYYLIFPSVKRHAGDSLTWYTIRPFFLFRFTGIRNRNTFESRTQRLGRLHRSANHPSSLRNSSLVQSFHHKKLQRRRPRMDPQTKLQQGQGRSREAKSGWEISRIGMLCTL